MEKIVCKECGKELSSKASVCPNCGVKTHPIKDTLKTVVIVLGVLIGLVLLVGIITSLPEIISDINIRKMSNKIIGTYELQTDNPTYEHDGIEVTFDKTMTIETVNNCDVGDKTCVMYDEITFEDKLIRKNTAYYNKDINFKGGETICYTFDDDILKQTPCNSKVGFGGISEEEMNITYKKVK